MKLKTKEILTPILRAQFDTLNAYWQYYEATVFIEAVKDAGFSELAQEMKTDL